MESSDTSRRATDQDLEAITETMTLAFADDPVWGGGRSLTTSTRASSGVPSSDYG